MKNDLFEPIIEGEIPAGGHPIFVKALTYGQRVIRLQSGFVKRHDHVRQARHMVVAHYKKYMKDKKDRVFPIRYYKYLIRPTCSIRISVSGDVLGVFEDQPANPSFTIVGERFEIGNE